MNWYKEAQGKTKRPKGWRVTVKKVKVDGGGYMCESHVFPPNSPIPTTIPMLSDYAEQARENAWAWLDYQLSLK